LRRLHIQPLDFADRRLSKRPQCDARERVGIASGEQ
jgi:hypothetical protein